MRKTGTEKPPLTLVDPATIADAPPRKFAHAGLSLWNSITGAYQVDDAGGIELLVQACSASDRLELYNYGQCENRQKQQLTLCYSDNRYVGVGESPKDQCLNRVQEEYRNCGYLPACTNRWLLGLQQCN
jgi:hypothetical protein